MDTEKGLHINIQMIVDDLNEMIRKLSPFSMDLMLIIIFSDIDFFGGLIYGFNRNNSKSRYVRFIVEFMSQSNRKYGNEQFANYLYENIRSILVHEAISRKFSSTNNYAEKYHVTVLELNEFDTLFIHPEVFKNEFLQAIEIFKTKLTEYADFKEKILGNFQNLFNINHRFSEEELNILQLEKLDKNNLTLSDLDNFIQTKTSFR